MVSEPKEVNYLRISFLCLVFIEMCACRAISDGSPKKNRTIFFETDSKTNIGFLSPEPGELQGNEKVSLIYNFENKQNPRSVHFNATLIFHEYYFNFKIFICNTRNHLRVHDVLEKIPYSVMDNVTGEYNTSCEVIDPVEYPVYNFTGPGFMEIYKNESFSYIPERFGLLSQDVFNHTFFNFTYVLVSNESKPLAVRQVPLDFFSPVASLVEGHACSLNGILVLRLVNRRHIYKYECKCLQGTYGNRCEYGPMCTTRKTKQSCFNHGYCRASIGSEDGKTCVCDAGFEGDDCRFPVLEKDDPMLRFAYNGTSATLSSKELFELKIKSLLPCNHSLQNASIEKDFQIDESAQMIRILNQTSSLYDEVSALAGKCRLPTKCSNLTIGNNMVSSSLKWNDVSLKSSTLIKSFEVRSKTLICCTICSAVDSVVFFFKDEIPINLTPIWPLSNKKWINGQLEIESFNHEFPEICLKIPHFSDNDSGKYRCQVTKGNFQQSQYFTAEKNQSPLLEVEPKAIAVVKESEVRVSCSWENRNWRIKPQWKVSPKKNFESFSYYPSGTTGSFILVHNITGELTVTCTIDNYSKIGSESKESQITIIGPEDYICESETAYNINWPKVQVFKNFTARCPQGYRGHCVRECSSVKNFQKHADWNLPDCSRCERKRINSMFANVTLYQKGIVKYLTNPKNLFTEVRDEFIHRNNSVMLPGESGTVVRQAIKFLEIPELVPDINVFYSWIDVMISSKDAIHEKDLNNLQTLLRTYPRILVSEICYLKISVHENVAFYQQTPRVQNEIFNESLSLNRSAPSEINRGRSHDQSKEIQNCFEKINVQFREKVNSKKRSITIFPHPELILPYRKRIFGKEAGDHKNYLEDDEFGEVSSPLVQINVYDDDELKAEKIASNFAKLTFYPCQLQSTTNYVTHRCGEFDPTSLTWNITKCSFSRSNNLCSCSCIDINGWIGLVAIDNQNVSKEFASMTNSAATWGSGISLVFLLFAAISFLIQCVQSSVRVFARFLETLALMVVNAVFLYCSLYETNEVAHMTVLMIISVSLVLVIGLSASHQVDIHQKCTLAAANPDKRLNPPSSIMLLVSTFVAVFLGGMLWIIAKVQKIKLSNAWLPETDDSTLSFAVLSFIFFLLILQFALAVYNWYKVKYIFHNPNWNTESLSSELKKRCIIGFLETIYIFSSWYQNADVGMYIFPLVSVTLGVAFFIFSIFTCSSHSGSSASRSSTSKADTTVCHENKLQKMVNRFTWKWLRIPYSGVAETEVSNIRNDDSMELGRNDTRGDGDSSFDASTISGYGQESPTAHPNCITTQVDIEFDCRIRPCNCTSGCVCSPLPSVREQTSPQRAVENFYTPSVVLQYPTNNNVKPNLEVDTETPTERYLNMEGPVNDSTLVAKKSCDTKPKVHCNGTNNLNRYVNMLPVQKENDNPKRRKSNGGSTVPRNENKNMYTHMNGNGNAKSTGSTPLCSLTKPVNHIPGNCKVDISSKSQNASPLVTRIAVNSRTKSVDALTSQMSPDERKKHSSSQFASLRHLISKTKSGSRHFDSGNCVYSENDLEKNKLIMTKIKSECVSPGDGKQEFYSNCQEDHEHHKRLMSP